MTSTLKLNKVLPTLLTLLLFFSFIPSVAQATTLGKPGTVVGSTVLYLDRSGRQSATLPIENYDDDTTVAIETKVEHYGFLWLKSRTVPVTYTVSGKNCYYVKITGGIYKGKVGYMPSSKIK